MRTIMTRWHHNCFNIMIMIIIDEGHLLRVHWFLLVDFARLKCQCLRLNVYCSTIALVIHLVLSLTNTTLWWLLLGNAHVLWLHHIWGHTQCLLVMGHSANRTDLLGLHIHYIQRFFWRDRIMNILIYGILSTKICILSIERVEHLTKGIIQPAIWLVHTATMRVLRHMLVASHLLVLVVLLHLVGFDDVC